MKSACTNVFVSFTFPPSDQSSLKLRALLVLELVPVIGFPVIFFPAPHFSVLLHPSTSHPSQTAVKTHLCLLNILYASLQRYLY